MNDFQFNEIPPPFDHLVVGSVSHRRRVYAFFVIHLGRALKRQLIKYPKYHRDDAEINTAVHLWACKHSCLSIRCVFHHSNLLNLAKKKYNQEAFAVVSSEIRVSHLWLLVVLRSKQLIIPLSLLETQGSSSSRSFALVNFIHFQVVFNEIKLFMKYSDFPRNFSHYTDFPPSCWLGFFHSIFLEWLFGEKQNGNSASSSRVVCTVCGWQKVLVDNSATILNLQAKMKMFFHLNKPPSKMKRDFSQFNFHCCLHTPAVVIAVVVAERREEKQQHKRRRCKWIEWRDFTLLVPLSQALEDKQTLNNLQGESFVLTAAAATPKECLIDEKKRVRCKNVAGDAHSRRWTRDDNNFLTTVSTTGEKICETLKDINCVNNTESETPRARSGVERGA